MMVVDDATIEFESRFADTETVPADQLQVKTDVLVRRDTISREASTRVRLISADMIQFLGDPDRIIAQKGLDPERLDHLKAHPSSATIARRICLSIPAFYPDRKQ
jgi:hypothetical protein